MIPMPEILLDTLCRFWSYVDVQSDSECWNWIGAISGSGYGNIKIYNKYYRAHRIAYYIHYQKDPGEFLVCHECDNKLCVNPHHLFLGTQQENIQHALDTGLISYVGSLHPQTRLLESDILEIRELQGTITQKEISKIYCVSQPTINHIMSRKTWRHI